MKRLELLLCGVFGAVSCALPSVSIDPTLGAAGSGGSLNAGGSDGRTAKGLNHRIEQSGSGESDDEQR